MDESGSWLPSRAVVTLATSSLRVRNILSKAGPGVVRLLAHKLATMCRTLNALLVNVSTTVIEARRLRPGWMTFYTSPP
jgi:transposase